MCEQVATKGGMVAARVCERRPMVVGMLFACHLGHEMGVGPRRQRLGPRTRHTYADTTTGS